MSHPATARLFIALDLPSAACEQLASWARGAIRSSCAQRTPAAAIGDGERDRGRRGHGLRRVGAPARGAHGIRALEAESLHLTVSFLGSRPVGEIEPLAAFIESCAQVEVGETSVGAPLWLPRRHPRALAVELHDDSGSLQRLHRTLLDDLRAAGLVAEEERTHGSGHRPLRPHVTVARLRRDAAPHDRTLLPTPQIAFRPQRLVLYRSWLSPEGASYEEIASSATVPAGVDGGEGGA
jgi:2'-5' RNA ligase